MLRRRSPVVSDVWRRWEPFPERDWAVWKVVEGLYVWGPDMGESGGGGAVVALYKDDCWAAACELWLMWAMLSEFEARRISFWVDSFSSSRLSRSLSVRSVDDWASMLFSLISSSLTWRSFRSRNARWAALFWALRRF